jgi:hypothetical protein
MMNLRPLTLSHQPPLGKPCVVYGSLMPHPGPGRYDVALLSVDDDGVCYWFGGKTRCEANVGCPSVVAWAELPPAAEVDAMLAVLAETKA